MVVTQQFRTIPQRNGLLRPLAAGAAGATGQAGCRAGARLGAPAGGLSPRLRRLNQRVTVPYWMLAVTLTAMVAGSVSAVQSFHAEPASAARAPIAQLAGVQPDEGLAGVTSPDGTGDTIDQLHQAIAAVTMNLERTERDNATLRDQQRQQAQDLSAAVNGTVFNEQQRAGEVQDVQAHGQQQTQQLQGEYNALMEGIAGQLTDLQQKAAAAAQLADKLKSALGV